MWILNRILATDGAKPRNRDVTSKLVHALLGVLEAPRDKRCCNCSKYSRLFACDAITMMSENVHSIWSTTGAALTKHPGALPALLQLLLQAGNPRNAMTVVAWLVQLLRHVGKAQRLQVAAAVVDAGCVEWLWRRVYVATEPDDPHNQMFVQQHPKYIALADILLQELLIARPEYKARILAAREQAQQQAEQQAQQQAEQQQQAQQQAGQGKGLHVSAPMGSAAAAQADGRSSRAAGSSSLSKILGGWRWQVVLLLAAVLTMMRG